MNPQRELTVLRVIALAAYYWSIFLWAIGYLICLDAGWLELKTKFATSLVSLIPLILGRVALGKIDGDGQPTWFGGIAMSIIIAASTLAGWVALD